MAKRKTTPAKPPAKRKPSPRPTAKRKPPASATPAKKRAPSPAPKKTSPAKPGKRPSPRTPAAAPAPKPPRKPPAPPAPPAAADDAYQRRKESARSRNADIAECGRDIGPIPEVVDPARRAACEFDLELYLSTYLSGIFYLGFCADQRRCIKKAEAAALNGDLFALAMPRGQGKTMICEGAASWALSYGHRFFAVLLAANDMLARKSLDSIKGNFETNELLAEDFPEICYPIGRLESIANRCKGQLSQGQPTRIVWTNRRLVLPTIAGSKASGAALHCCGILSGVRGLSHKTADGRSVRPDIFVGDDLQTDSTAINPVQCEKRLRVLTHTVLGLAGPDRCIAGLVPCTVISPGDVADTLLDRTLHPEFQGERCKLMYAMPADKELWQRYAEIRADSFAAGNRGKEATEFYAENRAAMDEGAEPSWPERFLAERGQISAVQYAMDFYIDDPVRFASEYQNEPIVPHAAEDELTVEQILARANGMPRRAVPIWATKLTAFVDVQRHLHFWVVVGWGDDFTGQVLDYGTCPHQKRAYFTMRDAYFRLDTLSAGGMEAQIRAGLDAVADELLCREWRREDGVGLKIGRALVDANWGDSSNCVYEFCRRSKHAALLTPSHGKGVGAGSAPMNQGKVKPKPGEQIGLNWQMPIPSKRAKPYVLFDANFWKSFTAERLRVPAGGAGRIELFGRAIDHKLFAEHLTSERGEVMRAEKSGREVAEWRLRAVGRDNHWWDGLVGCAVAASMLGVKLAELPKGDRAAGGPRRRLTFEELRRKVEERRNGQ